MNDAHGQELTEHGKPPEPHDGVQPQAAFHLLDFNAPILEPQPTIHRNRTFALKLMPAKITSVPEHLHGLRLAFHLTT